MTFRRSRVRDRPSQETGKPIMRAYLTRFIE
jgi:hypothetical protein